MARVTTDLVHQYLKQMGRYSLLTPHQEISYAKAVQEMLKLQEQRQKIAVQLKREPTIEELAEALGKTSSEVQSILHQGQRAKEHMLCANLRLVVSVAKKYQKRNLEFLDLIQEGTLGLYRAIEKFDPNRGYKFSTYAHWWIRQGITRAIGEKSRTIRLPIHINEKLNQIKKVQTELSQSLGRLPTITEIASSLGVTPSKAREYIQYFKSPVPLERPVGDDSSGEFGDFLPGSELSPEDQLQQLFVRDNLQSLLEESLTPQQREIISLRFGLLDGHQLSLSLIATRLKLSRERVRQIESKALSILRKKGRHLKN